MVQGVHDNVDAGKVVKCEVCHGPAGRRDPQQDINAATGPVHPEKREACRSHRHAGALHALSRTDAGRPLQQAQIVIEDHAGTQQCTLCHNPHSPTSISYPFRPAQPGDAAAGNNKAAACAGCHGAEGVSINLPGPTLAGQNHAYFGALTAYNAGNAATR